jgi:NAD(P)-dependent dehydrogenase (short-subunit alcohol dehydrogenase family)
MGIESIASSVVLVTGGGRGIGLAIARALALQGARVAVGDIDEGLARDAARSVGGFGGKLDVRDRASFVAFLAEAERALGPVDVLVNNAGIMPTGPFIDESDAISDTQIDVNVRGVILGTKLALPGMLARGRGHVINVASMAGRLAVPGLAVYCATKFAVVGLTETLVEEYRDSGVGFTSITPAKVTTELAAGTERAGRGVPTASAEEVADAVVYALRTGEPEVAVPRYIGKLHLLQTITPRWVERKLRTRLGDRRILNDLDKKARAAYDARIASLASREERAR